MMDKEIKLLLLDDDEVDRLHLKRALKSCGCNYTLTECEDASSILELAKSATFDCIFLDYLLPGENGLELLKRLREAEINTPVVIITSHGSESIAVDLMKSGASDYLIKNEINGHSLAQILRNIVKVNDAEREREKAEKALRTSEARLAEAQQIAKIGNWEYDIIKDSINWSLEMYKIFGHSPETFAPTLHNFFDYVPEEDKSRIQDAFQKALQGESFNLDFQIATNSGIKYTNSQGYALMSRGNIPQKLVGILQDITERKLAEKEINDARELAENSMKVREVFLANMSHEIRTPMNAILGFTRLIYETDLSKEQRGFVDAINFSGENLLVIINDILDLTKIQSGKMILENCEFNLDELIKSINSILEPKAAEKGLHLSHTINEGVPEIIKGDPVRLNQVLTNLLSNGIKFTDKGGVSLDIDASGINEKEFIIEFKIKDTGIGIPQDKQAAIFENFVQASSDTTRKYGGTGLGLTIVKNLVALQNGKIAVISNPGGGTNFVVHLPFEKATQTKSSEAKASLMVSESFDLLKGSRILVAEDNGVNQLLIRKVLEKVGCRVDIAANGLETLEHIKLNTYDVILMDIQMPEMDGHETTRSIRNSQSSYSNIPIIAMTAHAFSSDVSKSIAAGMNDHISKPFQQDVLYSTICKYLEKRVTMKVIQAPEFKNVAIDLSPIYEMGGGDVEFFDQLILLYSEQTPAFIEHLRGYLKSHNFGAIRSICYQIKSSYGILRLSELNIVLETLSNLFKKEKPESEIEEITQEVNIVISLISAITEEVKKNLRKVG
jgi:PAS domain S-box-containing protein